MLAALSGGRSKGMTYGRKRWHALTLFLDEGMAEMDNNITEHAMCWGSNLKKIFWSSTRYGSSTGDTSAEWVREQRTTGPLE